MVGVLLGQGVLLGLILELEQGLVHAQALVRLVEEPRGLEFLGQASVDLQEEEQLGSELVMVVGEVVVAEGPAAVVRVVSVVAGPPEVLAQDRLLGLAVPEQWEVLVAVLGQQGVREAPEGLQGRLVRLEARGMVEREGPLEEQLELEDLEAVQLPEAA